MTVVTLHIIKDATAIPDSCLWDGATILDCYQRNLDRIPTIPSSVTTVNLENDRIDEGATSLTILSLDNNLIPNLQAILGKDLINLHRLSMNHSLFTAMHNTTFVGLGNLKSILLSHNEITILLPGWCDGADNVSLVDLSDNKISSIGRTNWCLFTRLESLNLSNNKINRLQSNWTEGMVHLQYLDLQNNNLKTLKKGSFSFLTALLDLQLGNNSIRKVEVGWGRDLGKLTTLQLSQNKLKKLQPRLFSGMVRLTRIDIQAANIRRIHQGSFQFLEGLAEITLQYNSMTTIRKGVFSNLRSVVRLTLQSNKISHIEPRSFCGMVSLVELYLNNNRILHLFRFTFAGLRMLTHLDLQNNEIVSLSEYWNADLNNVRFIDMSWNNISNIEKRQSNYSYWGGPTDLDIPLTCGNESSMDALHLKAVPSLKFLDMSRNPVGTLLHRGIFQGLVELRYLILAYCNLKYIEGSYFTDLLSLKHLNISHNNIVRLDSDAFSSIPSVVAIDAKFNAMESVGPYTFGGKDLSFVDLGENALQTLSRDVLPKRFSEFKLRLTQNPLLCDCRITWLHKLITEERIQSVPMSFVDIIGVRCANINGSRLSSIPLSDIPCDPSLNLDTTTPPANEIPKTTSPKILTKGIMSTNAPTMSTLGDTTTPPANEIPKTTSPKILTNGNMFTNAPTMSTLGDTTTPPANEIPKTTSPKILTKGNMSTNAPTMSTLGDVNRETGVSSACGQNNAMQDKGTSQFFSSTNTVYITVWLLLAVVVFLAGKQQCGQHCRNKFIRARPVIYQDINSGLVMRPSPTRSPSVDFDTNHVQTNRNHPLSGHRIRLASQDFKPAPPPPPPRRREDLGQAITQTSPLEDHTEQRLRNNPVLHSKRVVKHSYFCNGLGSVQHRDGSLTALTQDLGDGNNCSEVLAKPRVPRHMHFRDHVATAPGCPLKTKVPRNEFHSAVTKALIREEASDFICVTRETKASNSNLTETTDGGADQEGALMRRQYFLDSNGSTCGTSNSTSLRGDDFERDRESHESGDDDYDDTSGVIIYHINQDEFATRTTDPGMLMKELAVSSYSSEDDFDCGIPNPEMDYDDSIEIELESRSWFYVND
eukprot:XP_011663654.1 PREDICTED: slit homolog 2 protein-like [Strongylocentrotus purpuratus]